MDEKTICANIEKPANTKLPPQLKPCPFCGGKAECGPLCGEDGGIYTDRMGAYCRVCGFELSSKPRAVRDTEKEGWPWRDLDEAITKWNTRAS